MINIYQSFVIKENSYYELDISLYKNTFEALGQILITVQYIVPGMIINQYNIPIYILKK
ncbi:hypothetical protein SDC9_168361 [bioreactor metagenome]|uniref:Uncharacterized protein n=1 Tax=bioreactor metagenome TaxID=1076179 RepID=A0A645G4U8_9ZZZZ